MPTLKQKYVRSNKGGTKLPDDIEADYTKSYAPEDSADYDMRGWYMERAMSPSHDDYAHEDDPLPKSLEKYKKIK